MHPLGHEKAKNRRAYSESMLQRFGDGNLSNYADKSDRIREAAIASIITIARRQAIVLSREAEWALVKSLAVDPSAKVRDRESRLLAVYGSRAAFNLLFTFMINAEEAKGWNVFEKLNESLGTMIEEMKKSRVRGSFLKAFLGLSSSSESLWKLAERNLLETYESSDIKNEIYQMVAKEQSKLAEVRGGKNELSAKRLRGLLKEMGKDPTASLKKKRMTAEAEMGEIVPPAGVGMDGEIVPPPKQMVKKPDDWDYDKVIISRGPVVDALCAAGRKIKMAFRGTKGPRR